MNSKPEYQQSFDIENCLGLMTDTDLERFFNLYKIIKNVDPNTNTLIKKASTEELLSGKLIDTEHLSKLCMTKVEESEPSNEEVINNVSSNDYTFFDVYDHIESWKKRINPMMNKIEGLVEEFKTISQRTSSADILKASNASTEQTIKSSNDDVVSNSNRYLSNIDKYIEIGGSHKLLSEVFQSSDGLDGTKISDEILHSESDKCNIQDKIDDAKEKNSPPIIVDEEKIEQLVPTNAYLENENITTEDEFEVNTYYKY